MALLYALPVLIQHLGIGALLSGKLRRWEPYLYGALAAMAWLEAGPDAAFIYFQF
jgi:alginate O-acetyltransferase complex protein AlgI